MKHKLALVLIIAALSVVPLIADDVAAPKSSPVEQKLREIDPTIVLKQYEHVKTVLADIRMQREFLYAEEGMTDKERNAKEGVLARKHDVLTSLAHSYRDEAVALEKQMNEANVAKTSK